MCRLPYGVWIGIYGGIEIDDFSETIGIFRTFVSCGILRWFKMPLQGMTVNVKSAMLMQILCYHIDKLKAQKTDHEFCEVLVTTIMRLIHFMYPDLIKRWEQEKKDLIENKRPTLENAAYAEMRAVHASLKERLKKADLLEQQPLASRLFLMQEALEGKPDVLLVPPLLVAYDHLKVVCCELLNTGRHDLISECATIRYSESLQEMVIDGFMLPALFELLEFDDVLTWSNRSKATCPAWVAWDTLRCLEWGWLEYRESDNKSNDSDPRGEPLRETRDDVRREKLCSCYKYIDRAIKRCDDQEACAESVYRLYLKDLRATVSAIKKRRQTKGKILLFGRDHISRALDIILQTIDPTYVGNCKASVHSNVVFPLSAELLLEDDMHLRLKVEWISGLHEILHVHSFQGRGEGTNITHFFIENLLQEDVGVPIELDKKASWKRSATECLEDVGIYGVLDKIFIARKDTYSACLRSKLVVLAEESPVIQRKLLRHINKLKTERWESSPKNETAARATQMI